MRNLIADGGTAVYDATIEGFRRRAQGATTGAHQRRRRAHRRRGHGLRRRAPTRWSTPCGAQGDSANQVRVFTIAYSAGAAGAAEALESDRRGLRRPGLHGRHRGHRGRLPEHLELLLMAGRAAPLQPRRLQPRADPERAARSRSTWCCWRRSRSPGSCSDLFLPVLAVGLVVYGIAAARTYFDEDEAQRCSSASARSGARRWRPARVDPAHARAADRASCCAPAHQREARIRDAVERAQLPYDEVSRRGRPLRPRDRGRRAARAAALRGARGDPARRAWSSAWRRCSDDPAKAELVGRARAPARGAAPDGAPAPALLRRDGAVLVELDTVRGNLVSVSASTEAANQQRLAAEVRALRDEVGARGGRDERGVRVGALDARRPELQH